MPEIHPFILIIDYILGVVMWTLIGRVAMNIFQRENSEFFFMKAFVKLTNPLIRLFKPITPSFHYRSSCSTLCGLVFLYDQILPYALSIGIFCDGNAVFSFRK